MELYKAQYQSLLNTPIYPLCVCAMPIVYLFIFFVLSTFPARASDCYACELNDKEQIIEDAGVQEESADALSVKPSVAFVMDYSSSKGVYSGEEKVYQLRLRRARFGVSTEINKDVSAELSVDVDTYAKSSLSMHSLEILFDLGNKRDLKIGLLKQPFGLEKSTSSKNLRTLERGIASDLFSPERAIGINFQTNGSTHYFSSGIYTDNNSLENISASGRFVWNPFESKGSVLHLGFSANHQLLSGNDYQRKSDGAVHDGKNILSITAPTPESVSTIGLEGAWMKGSLTLQAEWMVQRLVLDSDAKDPRMVGGYLQASWVFQNGYRKYGKGRFKKLTMPGGRTPTELVLGFGYVDARYVGGGALAKEASVTVNRYFSKNISLSGQLTRLEKMDSGTNENDDGTSLIVRLKTNF